MSTRPDPSSLPCSPLDTVGGIVYFPRMLAKIRLHAQGKLWDELHNNLGKGADGWLCGFLHVDYDELKNRVLQGGTDEEVFAWCQEHGRVLNDSDKLIWNAFSTKLGWNDQVSPILVKRKVESGLTGRDDIQTMPHFIDVDEGRKA